MRLMKSSNYLQRQILLLILLFTTVIGILLAAVSSYLYKNYLQKALLQNAEVNLQLLTDNIDKSIMNVKKLVSFCKSNTIIGEYTEKGYVPSNTLSSRAYDRLTEEYYANTAADYMHRVIVASNTGSYLQILPTEYSRSVDAARKAKELPFYEELVSASGYSFCAGFLQDPIYSGQLKKRILPVVRPISARYNASSSGWVMIFITEQLFTDPLSYYSLPEDSVLYLTLGEHTYLLTADGCADFAPDYALKEALETDFLTADTSAYRIFSHNSGKETLLVTKSIAEMPDCYITQSISARDLSTRRTLFLAAVICIILLVLLTGLIVSWLLYRTISLPVLKIRDRVDKISHGDFTRDTSIEWKHELGDIGRGINDMSGNIQELLDHRIEAENQKRDLEYKMLQSQINPHFIYNTLNSIKWMATIQGSEGIAEMTTALSRLLKSISKGTSILVPIKDELSLLRDYFTIQQYRYGGTITMQIQVTDPALNDCKIVKFTLQPLVENAIFHGIEPKGTAGSIQITIEHAEEEGCLRITVEDDGVGMSREKAERLLMDNNDRPADFFRDLGISSVHKRLQYEFGEKYGIRIDTKEGCYTRIILLLPETLQAEPYSRKEE